MIDLDKSELWADEYREYDPAWGKYIVPGLYYMWESADEADVYVIERMTPWEIADSNYMVGTVNKDDATGATNWTSVDTYALSIDPVDPWFSFGTVATGEDSAKNVEGTSSYYTLSYDVDSWDQWINGNVELDADSYTAALSDNLSRSAVLRQDVRGQEANYVLVARNSSDEILYAISFRNEDDFVDATDDDLFTRFVWMINTPAAPFVTEENDTAEIEVTLGDDLTSAVLNSTDDSDTGRIAYASDVPAGELKFTAEATTAGIGTEIIELENGWNGTDYVYRAVITSEDGTDRAEVTYTVSVTSVEKNTDLAISNDYTAGQAKIEDDMFGFTNNAQIEFNSLKEIFVPAGEFATASWKYTDEAGVEFVDDEIPTDADTAKGKWEVTITAQTGAHETYYLTNMYAITLDDQNSNNPDGYWSVKFSDTPEYVFEGTEVTATIVGTYSLKNFDGARYLDYSVTGAESKNNASNESEMGQNDITWTINLGEVNSDQEIVVKRIDGVNND